MDDLEKDTWNRRHSFIGLVLLTQVKNVSLGMIKPIDLPISLIKQTEWWLC